MKAFDADKLLDILDVMIVGHKSASDVYDVVDSMPTVDAVEVVRCKDCIWYENDGYHTNCQIMRFCVEAKDYCSRGERREDETD